MKATSHGERAKPDRWRITRVLRAAIRFRMAVCALALMQGMATAAYYSPAYDVTGFFLGSSRVSYSVTNPWNGQNVEQTWPGVGLGGLTNIAFGGGVVGWTVGISGYYAVFDTTSEEWRPGSRIVDSFGGGSTPTVLSVSGGAVAWRHGLSVYFATYNPNTTSWVEGSGSINGSIISPRNFQMNDGVVAWAIGASVYYAIHDPRDDRWHQGQDLVGGGGDGPAISIQGGTVRWPGHTRGYRNGEWYDGPTAAQAHFIARLPSGNPPLRVSFWDCSIGVDSWNWDFGDGSRSNQRSPIHIYTKVGRYQARLAASGPAGTSLYTVEIVVGNPHEGQPPPEIVSASSQSTGATTATLLGQIRPNSDGASAWFEYGRTTEYSGRTEPFSLGVGANVATVVTTLTGLSFDSEYHFRLVSTNRGGITFGSDGTFVTLAAARPILGPISFGAGVRVVVHLSGTQGVRYLVSWSEDLINWFPLGFGVEVSPGAFEVIDPSVVGIHGRFYRATAQ